MSSGTAITFRAPAPRIDEIHPLALRLSVAYALAKEAGHSEADCWKNVALVAVKAAEERS